ncbi:hypothetical protein [Haloarchaeobius amylolyticus]|uniref:hypothetical protein n=1 Tax=Haloarchaeobius amylolyticus TaxID=1198296 RepID=UPI00226FD0F1|nr:hypothetical protein [Haloarchaeobius amylolyticus]
MSVSGWYGGYTIDATRDGVTVRKGLDLETLPLPAIKFAFESAREAPVGVRLTEQLPEDVTFDDVAVHTDHDGVNWTGFEDGRLVYTGSVPPGETVVTLYMVWLQRPEHIYRFLTEPYLRVTSDPNAPSLRPVGVETDVRSVDRGFSRADRFTRVLDDVERSLGTPVAPAQPESPGEDQPPETEVQVDHGTTAWPHPVHRAGEGDLDLPTSDDIDDLAEASGGPGDHLVRVETTDTYHGGGAVVVVQELANAFDIRGRRLAGEGNVDVVEAVVRTDQPTERIVSALADRSQVSDVLVSPLFESDAPEPLPAAEGESESQSEDAAAEFAAMQAEFDPVDAAELEAELDEVSFPGLSDDDELSIDELVASVEDDGSGDEETAVEEPAVEEGTSDDVEATDEAGATAMPAAPDASSAEGSAADVATVDTADTETPTADGGTTSTASADVSTEPDDMVWVTESEPTAGGEPAAESEAPTAASATESGTKDENSVDTNTDEDADSSDGPPAWGSTFEPFAEPPATAAERRRDAEPSEDLEVLREEIARLTDRIAELEAELETARSEQQPETGRQTR